MHDNDWSKLAWLADSAGTMMTISVFSRPVIRLFPKEKHEKFLFVPVHSFCLRIVRTKVLCVIICKYGLSRYVRGVHGPVPR